MDDLPEVPFEKVLSYLNLRDRLQLSAVSRSCHEKIANSRVKTLCYSGSPLGFIWGKSRWVSGPFTENFISSTKFASFFDAYGHSVLSCLKQLRLCNFDLRESNETAFTRTLNSFGQLEELDIIRVQCCPQRKFELTLPMLTSIRLEDLTAERKLTLDAPRLRNVRILSCPHLRLDIVHDESVESFIVCSMDDLRVTDFNRLKNLKRLYVTFIPRIDPTFLSDLPQLKEVHLDSELSLSQLFSQKQQYGRDLKIYQCGLLLNSPDDPESEYLVDLDEALACLAKNPSRLADEIPFYRHLDYYRAIDRADPGLDVDVVLNRATELHQISVSREVYDVQRFLGVLKNHVNIRTLDFGRAQPQELFDRLPKHCAIQCLTIFEEPSDLGFLLRLKHLIQLVVYFSVDAELVRKAFEKLPFLSIFEFVRYAVADEVTVKICRSTKQFTVSVDEQTKTVSDLNAAIEFGFGIEKPKKRKV